MASSRTVTVNIVGDASGLNRALGSAGDQARTTGSRISGAFKGAFGVISNMSGGAFAPLANIFSSMGPAMDSLSDKAASFGEKMAGVGAGIAGIGMAASMIGSSDVAAQNQLSTAITNTGGTWAEYKGQVDDAVKSGEKYGYTANLTMNALQTLTTATGSYSKAQGALSVVQNLAASKHVALTAAATMYARVLGGTGTKTLSQFGITTADVAAKMKESNGTMNKGQAAAALLAAAVKGQAAAAADTFKGKIDHLKASIEDTVSEMATKLGPTLQIVGLGMTAVGSGMTIASAIADHFKEAQEGAATATDAVTASQDGLAASDGIAAVATDAEAAATGLEDVALGAEDAELAVADAEEGIALGPILLIIAAVALLGVGIYELATHWHTVWNGIKNAVVAVWHGIDDDFIHPVEGFFQAIPAFVAAHWQLLLAILMGPIGLAVLFIKNHFNAIKQFFADFPGDMASIAAHMWDWVGATFKTALDEVISLWNDIGFTVPAVHVFGQKFGGEHIQVPQIPLLAAGGIVTGPTLAMIGEGGPEAVIPLGASGGTAGAGAARGHSHDIYIDGRLVGQAVMQHVRTGLLQTTARSNTKVGLA